MKRCFYTLTSTAVDSGLTFGGSIIGAALGSILCPGVGTIIGALIGAIGGAITSAKVGQSIEAAG